MRKKENLVIRNLPVLWNPNQGEIQFNIDELLSETTHEFSRKVKADNELRREWVSVNDFCKIFGLGRTKTYELINQGTLTASRYGGRTFISLQSARNLAAMSTVTKGSTNDQ